MDIPAQRPKWLEDIGYYDDEERQNLRVLLVGESGCGKTDLSSRFPKPFFIDTDAGGKTLRKRHVPFVPAYDSKGIVSKVFDVLTALEKKTGPFAPGAEYGDVRTIVLDSFSMFSNGMLYDYVAQTGKDPKVTKASFDEYGKVINTSIEMGKMARRLSLSYNVVWTALVDVNKDELTGQLFGGPLCVGQYRQLIGADFDEMWFLQAEGQKDSVKRFLYTSKTGIYSAKTRMGLPYKIEVPADVPASTFITGLV